MGFVNLKGQLFSVLTNQEATHASIVVFNSVENQLLPPLKPLSVKINALLRPFK